MSKSFFSCGLTMLILIITSCASFPALIPAASANPGGPRTIILDGEAFSEDEVGNFVAWYCQDFIEEGPILVEVGFFENPSFSGLGFILFDGGYEGEKTYYSRTGLEHRWDWGPNGNDYAFVIQTDGTGLYYDFSAVKKGGSTKASAVYKCHKRM